MATYYSYKPYSTSGVYGTTIGLNTEGCVVKELCAYEDKHYFMLVSGSLPKQDSGINCKKDTLPQSFINNIKQEKLQHLAELKYNLEKDRINDDMFVNSSLGFKANADFKAQDNINALINAYPFSDELPTTEYFIYDGSTVQLTKEQLIILGKECALNGLDLYQQAKSLKNALLNATTYEELEAVDVRLIQSRFNHTEV